MLLMRQTNLFVVNEYDEIIDDWNAHNEEDPEEGEPESKNYPTVGAQFPRMVINTAAVALSRFNFICSKSRVGGREKWKYVNCLLSLLA